MQGSACRHRHRHDYTLVAHQPLPPARSGVLRDTDGVITSRLIRALFADTYLEPFAFGVKLIGVEELAVASLRNFFEIWPKIAFVFLFFFVGQTLFFLDISVILLMARPMDFFYSPFATTSLDLLFRDY